MNHSNRMVENFITFLNKFYVDDTAERDSAESDSVVSMRNLGHMYTIIFQLKNRGAR